MMSVGSLENLLLCTDACRCRKLAGDDCVPRGVTACLPPWSQSPHSTCETEETERGG